MNTMIKEGSNLLNIIDGLKEAIVILIGWINLQFSQQFPARNTTLSSTSFWFDEAAPEAQNPLYFTLEEGVMVEIFSLVEFLELVVDYLSLIDVRFDGKILLILFSDKILELLLHL
jgi:hypothetical protein